ncbi:MAG: RNA-directed DNA polymerase [Spirulinaceae cyanobacterium]
MSGFKLSEQELDNALSAINHHGYSAMLPEPVEWAEVQNNWQDIKDDLKKIDLDTYEPYKPMKIFAPKNRANIRVVHLLHPQDLIIYTALTLIVKDDIEKKRLSKRTQRVFSFRVNTKKVDRLYDSRGGYSLFTEQLNKKAKKANVKYVGVTDIADFYPRIYQHRLENVIQTLDCNPRSSDVARVLVKKFISKLMELNSYGIPVGPYASRILAEAVLIDVDSFLTFNKIDFVRGVDDFHVVCKAAYEAQASLFRLGEWLYSNHGLTLQSSKTKIYTISRYKKMIAATPGKNLSERDTAVALLQKFDTGYKDGDNEKEELDEDEVSAIEEEFQAIDLLSMLKKSISDKSLVDYKIVKYVLTKLPRISGSLDELKHEILDVIIDNAGLLYPVSEEIAKYILSFKEITKSEKKQIGNKLLKPLTNKHNPPPDYYLMWILYIFSTSEDWNYIKEITNIYQNSNSEITKRYAALAIAKGGSRNEALIIKDNISAASPLRKLAILEATKKLGKDERKHWKREYSSSFLGILEKKI